MKANSNKSEREAVIFFLKEVKNTITKKDTDRQGWIFVKRKENMACLAELGFIFRDVRHVILRLTVSDYCKGPLQDPKFPGDVWIFGKNMASKEIYIKLKLASFERLKIVRVISFHPARQMLCYPYRS